MGSSSKTALKSKSQLEKVCKRSSDNSASKSSKVAPQASQLDFSALLQKKNAVSVGSGMVDQQSEAAAIRKRASSGRSETERERFNVDAETQNGSKRPDHKQQSNDELGYYDDNADSYDESELGDDDDESINSNSPKPQYLATQNHKVIVSQGTRAGVNLIHKKPKEVSVKKSPNYECKLLRQLNEGIRKSLMVSNLFPNERERTDTLIRLMEEDVAHDIGSQLGRSQLRAIIQKAGASFGVKRSALLSQFFQPQQIAAYFKIKLEDLPGLNDDKFIMQEDKPFNNPYFVQVVKDLAMKILYQLRRCQRKISSSSMHIAMRLNEKTFKNEEAESRREYVDYLKFLQFIDDAFADAEVAARASEMKYVHPLDFYSRDLEEEDNDENGATSGKSWHDRRNLGVFQSLLKQ
ncbi:hypothetical protein MP228_012490 [Amoeboaphelidium protococcarum]|nr:hypothetical protein MP228_012490 [Amoeboaphelidium protococcarum]